MPELTPTPTPSRFECHLPDVSSYYVKVKNSVAKFLGKAKNLPFIDPLCYNRTPLPTKTPSSTVTPTYTPTNSITPTPSKTPPTIDDTLTVWNNQNWFGGCSTPTTQTIYFKALSTGNPNLPTNRLYISTDFGYTWKVRPLSPVGTYSKMRCNQDGTKVVDGGTWFSSDSGKTWTQKVPFAGARSISWDGNLDLSIIVLAVSTKFYAVGTTLYQEEPSSMWITYDFGDTWTQLTNAPTGEYSTQAPTNMMWSDVKVTENGVILATTKKTANYSWASFVKQPTGYLYKSIDGGISWSTTSSIGNADWAKVFASPDATKIIVVKTTGFTVSTNSGVSWSARTTIPSPHYLEHISFDASVMIASNSKFSTDNGQTWKNTKLIFDAPQSSQNTPYTISHPYKNILTNIDGTRIISVTNNRLNAFCRCVLITTNPNKDINSQCFEYITVNEVKPQKVVCYSSAANQITVASSQMTVDDSYNSLLGKKWSCSTNSGLSWRNITLPLCNWSQERTAEESVIFSSNGQYGLAVINSSSAILFFYSADFGDTWTPLYTNHGFGIVYNMDISSDGQYIVIHGLSLNPSTNSIAAYSKNAGQTFYTHVASATYSDIIKRIGLPDRQILIMSQGSTGNLTKQTDSTSATGWTDQGWITYNTTQTGLISGIPLPTPLSILYTESDNGQTIRGTMLRAVTTKTPTLTSTTTYVCWTPDATNLQKQWTCHPFTFAAPLSTSFGRNPTIKAVSNDGQVIIVSVDYIHPTWSGVTGARILVISEDYGQTWTPKPIYNVFAKVLLASDKTTLFSYGQEKASLANITFFANLNSVSQTFLSERSSFMVSYDLGNTWEFKSEYNPELSREL